MIVGLGENKVIELLLVVWPSGKQHQVRNVPAGYLMTAFENPADSENGYAFGVEPYRRSPTNAATPTW